MEDKLRVFGDSFADSEFMCNALGVEQIDVGDNDMHCPEMMSAGINFKRSDCERRMRDKESPCFGGRKCRLKGGKGTSPRNVISKEAIKKMRKLREKGLGCKTIAAILDINYGTVSNYTKDIAKRRHEEAIKNAKM